MSTESRLIEIAATRSPQLDPDLLLEAVVILDSGTSPDAGRTTDTPLLLALHHGHFDLAEQLVACGASANRRWGLMSDKKYRRTALMEVLEQAAVAMDEGRLEDRTRLLVLAAALRPQVRRYPYDSGGLSLLVYLAAADAETLFTAELDAVSPPGASPTQRFAGKPVLPDLLGIAACARLAHLEAYMTRYLTRFPEAIEQRFRGELPLLVLFDQALWHDVTDGFDPDDAAARTTAARCLLAHGADINTRSRAGATVLHHALNYVVQDLVPVAIALGVDETLTDDQGRTGLDLLQSQCAPGMRASVALALARRTNATVQHQPDAQELRGARDKAILMALKKRRDACVAQTADGLLEVDLPEALSADARILEWARAEILWAALHERLESA